MRHVVPLLLLGCSEPPVELSGNGYVDVAFPAPDGLTRDVIDTVLVAGVPAYDLRLEGGTLTVTVQGGDPGEAEAIARTSNGDVVLGTVAYAPPVDPIFDRMVAVGASYTMGFQDGVASQRAQLHSYAALLAKQAGAFLPLPLFRDDLFEPLGFDAVGPPPDCRIPDHAPAMGVKLANAYGTALETGGRLGAARVTPELPPRNVAVGNAPIGPVVRGPDPRNIRVSLLWGLALAPDVTEFGQELGPSQLDLLEEADPTLVVALDLVGNDVLGAIISGERFDPEGATPLEDVLADLRVFLDRATATGAEVLLGDIPPGHLLPRVSRGAVGADDVEAFVALAETYNAAIREVVAGYDQAHIVDLAPLVELVAGGVTYDEVPVDMSPLGGATSVDGTHLGDVGHAEMANLFLEVLSTELGVEVPPVDAAALFAASPHHPDAIRAAGRDPDACR